MSDPSDFSKMLEPIKIGSFTAANRVKYAACSISNFNDRNGFYTEREFARMEVIARTGCGIITNQGAYPDAKGEGKAYYRQLALYDDKFIPGFQRVADMLKSNGAVAVQQILHGGRYGGIDLDYCLQPSAVEQTLRHFRPPREITRDEIEQVIDDHVTASRRALKAGFDGIEITSFQGYLLANFLSSFTNKREDEYGGSVENRARFMVEMLRAIRGEIGSDKLLIVRLNGEELMDEYGGTTPEECVEFMRIAAEDGGVDMISVVVGWHESRYGALGRDLPVDHWVYLARNAKEKVKVPIAFGPRCRDPLLAEQLMREGVFDFWEVCRPFLADPQLLHKIKAGALEEVKPCLGGLTCLARMFNNLPYVCEVNPALGHEYEESYRVTPAIMPKRVLVAGGGPGGLEYALTAAKRGHDVTLYEKTESLGGQLVMAAKEISRGNTMMELVSSYETNLANRGVDIKLNTVLTPEILKRERPDVLVMATGSRVDTSAIPGFDDFADYMTVDDVLWYGKEPGQRVTVLGGNRAGLVLAENLAVQGKDVTVIEEARKVAGDVTITFKWRHKAWLKEHSVAVREGVSIVEYIGNGVRISNGDGKQEFVESDTVIVAAPRVPNNELYSVAENLVDELYILGDAVMPRSLCSAIHEGYKLGTRV